MMTFFANIDAPVGTITKITLTNLRPNANTFSNPHPLRSPESFRRAYRPQADSAPGRAVCNRHGAKPCCQRQQASPPKIIYGCPIHTNRSVLFEHIGKSGKTSMKEFLVGLIDGALGGGGIGIDL